MRSLRRRAYAAVAAAALALAGCSPVDVLNAWAPTERTRTASGTAYGPEPRQRLDVYRPAEPDGAPIVVFFYGGRWQQGERGDYAFVGAALADAGAIAVVADYRLYPAVRFPAFVHDGARATRWALEHAGRLGGDPRRVYVMGHSAGAHIAALLALDRRYLGRDADRLAGMIGLAGPYDFLPIEANDLRAIFGPPERFPRSQPITFARGDAPPLLLIHGRADETVSPDNTTALAAAVREAGGDVETRLVDDIGHAALIGAMSGLLDGLAPVRPAVMEFLGEASARAARATGAGATPR